MSEERAILAFEGVSKRFGEPGAPGALEVLADVDLVLRAGESAAIVGPSGSGKSTLLHLAGALDRPSAGRVLVDGADVAGLDERGLAALRSRKVGFVFQSHHLLPQCTALENALVPTLVVREAAAREAAGERARCLLERVGLAARASHRPAELSGGERQRVALVRALVHRPPLLLADEPTGSLDARSADALADLLVEIEREEGVALLVVTHSERLAERMERRLELVAGRLREVAPRP